MRHMLDITHGLLAMEEPMRHMLATTHGSLAMEEPMRHMLAITHGLLAMEEFVCIAPFLKVARLGLVITSYSLCLKQVGEKHRGDENQN